MDLPEAESGSAALADAAGPSNVESPPVPTPGQKRFEVELEFLQCLSSPTYLNFLAQNQYFEDRAFVRYLSYLMYWTRPSYAKFVAFPQALYFLCLLQRPPFREALKSADYALLLHQQQGYHWQFAASPSFVPYDPNAPPPDPAPSPETPATADTPLQTPATTPSRHG